MATNSSYTPLEPDIIKSISKDGAPLSFNANQSISLFTSTSFIYVALISACIVATAFVWIRGSLWRMEASESGIRKSNEEFKRGTLGLLGVLSLFLILYTVNRDLLTGEVGLVNLKTTPSTSSSSQIITSSNTSKPTPTTGSMVDAINGDASIRAQLASNNISVNKPVCSDPSQTNCTTVGGLPASTLTMLSSLRSQCTGKIEITGGTEAGHLSHGPNKTPVDISILNNNGLNDCIRRFPQGPNNGKCYYTYKMFGFIFCDEISATIHWHVYQ